MQICLRVLMSSLNNRFFFLNNFFLNLSPIHYLCRFKKKNIASDNDH